MYQGLPVPWLGSVVADGIFLDRYSGAELFIKPDDHNLSAAEEEVAKKNIAYDIMLYIIVPMQFTALYFFLQSMQETGLTGWDRAGRILSMGMCCGILASM